MVKRRKGFNWKAREQNKTNVDRSEEKKISVEIEGLKEDVGYDDSNVLALPASKRQTAKEVVSIPKKKKLSKTQRRKLEGVLKRKEKKANRESVLESLASHQVGTEELSQLIGISEVQTGRLKRKLESKTDDISGTINIITGSNKKRRKQDVEVESSDGEESVHTSDMSSDEEDQGEVTGGDLSNPDNIESVVTESEDLATAVVKEESKTEDLEDCFVDKLKSSDDRSSDIKHSTESKTNGDLEQTEKKRIQADSDRTVGSKSGNVHMRTQRRRRSHVRSASGKWLVEELVSHTQNDDVKNESKGDVTDKGNNETLAKEASQNVSKSIKGENGGDTVSGTVAAGQPEKVTRKTVHVPVAREKEIQDARLKLPILSEEQLVMEAITHHPVVIICGETGSGKTTQVPQFLYEAGYAHGGGIIGVTEPRRVAAISMSARVAMEMSLTSREVSYQIRYEGNSTPDTKIKFMTDGVLLKEVQKDFMLTKYSAIVIDEAHERSMYTDILIGLLSRIVPLRNKKGSPLKLVIMSATLRVEDFTENKRLFKEAPPVVKVDSRQFPVTIHYNKRTPLESYLNEVYRKTCKIHSQLPEGGILIFVTGQQEVHTLCHKLKQTFPLDGSAEKFVPPKKKSKKKKEAEKEELPKLSLDNYSVAPVDDEEEREGGESDVNLDLSDNEDFGNHGDDEEESLTLDKAGMMSAGAGCTQPLYVLPLYSLMSSRKQAKVFGPVPEGCRLCVVATNVAETSLTIPNIKYVVDSGKVKTKFYDKVTGVSTFRVTWTSKAGANQRAGRAGRVGPGHCYRLFSSAVFNDDFEKFSAAEITRRPVDDLVLQMKDMNIDKVLNFPYPTPPDLEQIQAAEKLLISLGALTAPTIPKSFKETKKAVSAMVTPLGRAMACFPVSPRYGKMLALGHQEGLLPYVIIIVSALSVQEMFVELHGQTHEESEKEEFKQRLVKMLGIKHRWAGAGHSLLLGDLMVMLKAVGSCEYEGFSYEFCEGHGLRYKAMREIRKLRMQLTNTVNTVIPDANLCVDPKMAPPDETQAKHLRQIVLAGLGDHVARKLPDLPALDPNAKKLKHAYQCPDLDEPVFIHPTSVLYKRRPEYVIYQHMEETSKLYMKGIVAIESEWLPSFAQSLVTLSKPLAEPAPSYNEAKDKVMCHRTGTFGNCSWSIPATELEYPFGIEKVKWFAKSLLEGKVVRKFEKFTPDLLSAPSTMVKTWAKLQPRTDSLMRALMSEKVDSRQALVKVCKKNPSYLLSELQEWTPESRHTELAMIWPPS